MCSATVVRLRGKRPVHIGWCLRVGACVVQQIRTMYTHTHTLTWWWHLSVVWPCVCGIIEMHTSLPECARMYTQNASQTPKHRHTNPQSSRNMFSGHPTTFYTVYRMCTDICIHHRMCSLTYADCSQCQIAIHVENEYHTRWKIERGSDVFCTSTHIFGYLNNSN